MIVHYDEHGFINHTQSEPADAQALAVILAASQRYKHLPPQPYPEVPLLDNEGNITIDEATGEARMMVPGYYEPKVSILTHYVDMATDEIVERPVIEPLSKTVIQANGKDFIPISGLPDPTTVYVDGVAVEVTGGRLDFASDSPGTYRLSIGWPCKDWTAEIIAK